jgi:hypothetical protein
MKTKFAIGCLIQWYEVNIIESYLQSLKDAINTYNINVTVDILISGNEELEKAESQKIKENAISDIESLCNKYGFNSKITYVLTTIADYRREFNEKYCEEVDVLVWGESDMLVPKQMFVVLDSLHQSQSNITPKYLATFGICKMWDDSWKVLEHPEFTNMEHSDSKNDWWSLNYDMNIDEMNSFNDKISELDVKVIDAHKFNGCGLVISSEVIKSGVNIPRSAFFIHEDTALMLMTQKVLGHIPQYHFKNILLVHNRKHKYKRSYIVGETGETVGQKRNSNKWYTIANKMCEQNVYNIFNPKYKSFTWEDVWKSI